ncbi:unnamed protein product [Fusarium venenatum]|uniref:Uncharacterized protein n=2 Tax=Fusarium venenatum TaxID=56646 RepID=A0A2L2TM33_9HYPO|nr:uncharacterized protein FVRRES_04691 [Fusarium venenatum]CEI60255.1 unnamed protein product [Fusarium venenatum]
MASPGPQLMRKWAQLLPEVLQVFREICDTLARTEPSLELNKFYVHMNARLFILSNTNEEIPGIFSSHLSTSQILQQLLYSLDRVYIGDPSTPVTNYDPSTLQGLNNILQAWRDSSSTKAKYASTCLDFGSKARRDEMISYLKEAEDVCRMSSTVDRGDIGADPDICVKTRQMPPLDIWPVAQSVYSALDSSNMGPCNTCNVPHGYGARLCIETYRAQYDTQGYDFDMFLGLDQLWQEARVRQLNNSVVKFIINDDDNKTTMKTSIRVRSLCRQIKDTQKRCMFRLNFEVRGNELWKTKSERSRFVGHVSEDVVSLSHFINKQPHLLNGKTKRILAVLLGYAVLNLHGTEWLKPTLSSDNILFFKTNGTVPLKPYLQVHINSKTATHSPMDGNNRVVDEDEDQNDPDYELCFHPYPCLVSLALILIELHQGRSIQMIAEENNLLLPDEETDESRFLLAGHIFEFCQQDFEDQTRMAIDACLNPNIGNESEDTSPHEDNLRTAIYQDIVRRLEDELEQGHSYISVDGLDTLAQTLDFARFGRPIKPEKTQSSGLSLARRGAKLQASKRNRDDECQNYRRIPGYSSPASRFPTLSDTRRPSFFDDGRESGDITTVKKEAYKSWRGGVIDVYSRYAPDVAEKPHVKIVVLDTGVDRSHLDFDAYEDRIKASVSYVGNDRKNVRDTSGHGTHVTTLLCEYAPDADIYIMKIAEYDPVSPSMVARAINDAVTNWQPDIISMSFGWPARDDGYESLEKAIKNAQFHDVLLFAAASNDGANAQRAWPARHPGVICIHSTTADGNPSPFNPIAIPGDNFAVVGEAVEGAWPRHLCDEQVNKNCLAYKSGTSFATPIAAGIAAFLLQYARSKLGLRQFTRLKQFEGMTTVLRRISVEKQGYNYIAPRLHPDNFFGKSEEFIQTNLYEALL